MTVEEFLETYRIKLKVIEASDIKTKVRMYMNNRYVSFTITHEPGKKPSTKEILVDIANRLKTYEKQKAYYQSVVKTIRVQTKLHNKFKRFLKDKYSKLLEITN